MGTLNRMYVNGEWIGAGGGAEFEVRDPATGQVVGLVPDGGAAETRLALDAAAAAFPKWSAVPAKDRGVILQRIGAGMESKRDDIARLIVSENGKPFEEAKKEVAFALGYFAWFAEESRRLGGQWVPSPMPGKRLWVFHQPVGPVAAITPWNFPSTMVTRKIAPALAAGCPVVLKPASATPLTALALAEVCHEAGLPAGVFNVVTSKRSSVVAEEILADARIRKIGFTGSTDVGKWIMERAAKQLKRLSFELGGNAPFIVFDDADLAAAVEGALKLARYVTNAPFIVFDDADLAAAVEGAVAIKFLRVGGQSCICANRIYVQQGIAGRFIPAFTEAVKKLVVAPGFEPGAQVGPLINAAARESVHALVEDAVRRGARVATGGGPLAQGPLAHGYFYAPTVLLDVTDNMRVCQEEIFGPVAPVATFASEDEAVRRANDTSFGLAAYFYTRDMARLVRVAERLEYGLVGANDAAGYTHEIPFGGFKESGLGREGGHDGLEEYMEVKSVVVNLG